MHLFSDSEVGVKENKLDSVEARKSRPQKI